MFFINPSRGEIVMLRKSVIIFFDTLIAIIKWLLNVSILGTSIPTSPIRLIFFTLSYALVISFLLSFFVLKSVKSCCYSF